MNGPAKSKKGKEINWVAVSAIAGVVAAVATFVGLFISKGSPGEPVVAPSAPSTQVTPSFAPSASGDSGAISSSPASSPAPGVIPVRNKGTLTVSDSCSATYDLDSTSSDWGEGNTFVFKAEFQSYCGSSLLVEEGASYKQVPDNSKIAFSTCQGTGYGGGGSVIHYSDLNTGEKFCFKTTEGRLSLLDIRSVSNSSLMFYVTTWQPIVQ